MRVCAIVREAREISIQKREMKDQRKVTNKHSQSTGVRGQVRTCSELGKQECSVARVGLGRGAGEELWKPLTCGGNCSAKCLVGSLGLLLVRSTAPHEEELDTKVGKVRTIW